MEFVIDTCGENNLLEKDCLIESDDEDDIEINNAEFDVSRIKRNTNENLYKKPKFNSSKDIDLDEFEKEMGWKKFDGKISVKPVTDMINELNPVEKILQKSAIKPGFEKLKIVPGYDVSDKKLKNARRKLREKTKGKDWFNLPATEMTEEIQHDLEIIQMRSALDPKRFYKKNDMKVLPKYFQIGKVLDSPLDYYNNRLTKKERKQTIVEELMADAEFSKFNKRKYKEIIDEKRKHQYKAHRHAKRLKGKRK